MSNRAEFADVLRGWMELRSDSQMGLAKRAGVSRQIIQRYLATDDTSHSPTLVQLQKLAGAYGVDVSRFLMGPHLEVPPAETAGSDANITGRDGRAEAVSVPLHGSIPSAGHNLNSNVCITVPAASIPDGCAESTAALKVATEEMYPTLRAGDVVLYDFSRKNARSQEIVLGHYKKRAVIRRFVRQGHRTMLLADNPNFPPVELEENDHSFVLVGVVTALVERILL